MPPVTRRSPMLDLGLAPPLPAPDAGPIAVDLAGLGEDAMDDMTSTELEDGGIVLDFAPAGLLPEPKFDANLAELMDPAALDLMTAELIEAVEEDKKSREEWEQGYLEGMKLLALKIEDRNYPFAKACGVIDPLLLEAVIRGHAILMSELMPASGPVKSAIVGVKTAETEAQASRVSTWCNYFLTEVATEYYEDRDQLFLWCIVTGSMFSKTYIDPVLGRPTSPYITPENLIVNYGAANIETAPRVTHVTKMTRRDMKLHQLAKIYRDVDVMEPDETDHQTETEKAVDRQQGTTPAVYRSDHRYTNWEIHADLDLKGFEHMDPDGNPSGLPLPYRVTINLDTRKCLAIYRNWKEDDIRFDRKQFFAHYKFLPGFGFYGNGFAHVMGGHAKARTSIVRQLIDAGTLSNFPGGMRIKGLPLEDNNLMLGPGQFVEIDTGGLPIDQAIKPLPYKEPSEVLMILWDKLGEQQRSLGGTTEIAVGEGRQDAPVGTTTALIEAAMKPQSGIMKRLHRALKREFKLFHRAMCEWLPKDKPYPFPVLGGEGVVMWSDFDNRIDVVPVSDPNITSSTQRMMRAESKLKLAQAFPQVHDIREALMGMYVEMGEDLGRIAKLMPPQQQAQPEDPVTENMKAMTNGQLAVAPWQDHESHIAVHAALIENPVIASHLQEHMAHRYRALIEQAMGQPLPPLGQQMPPEIQNQIAMMAAQATQQIKDKLKADQGGADAMALALKDLEIKAQEVLAKVETAKIKAASDSFKATLDHEGKTLDRESEEKIAAARIAADLEGKRMSAHAQMNKPQPQRSGP